MDFVTIIYKIYKMYHLLFLLKNMLLIIGNIS